MTLLEEKQGPFRPEHVEFTRVCQIDAFELWLHFPVTKSARRVLSLWNLKSLETTGGTQCQELSGTAFLSVWP